MEVSVEGNILVIRIEMNEPTPSASGKTLVVASTHGNKETSVKVKDKNVYLGLNAYIYPDKA